MDKIIGVVFGTDGDGLPEAEVLRADLSHGSGQRRSCGGHLRLFDAGLKSWRDLPVRYSEFVECDGGNAGALGDHSPFAASVALDAHVLCLSEQIRDETTAIIAMVRDAYAGMGLPDLELVLRPGFIDVVTVGIELEEAEAAFVGAAMAAGVKGIRQSDRTLPTGPGLQFLLPDRKGRLKDVGTLQLDVITASLNGTRYVAKDGGRSTPAILHFTVVNSIAQVIAMVLEQHQGRLPYWMAPVQVAVLPVSALHADFASHATAALKSSGLRSLLFAQRETLSRRIVRVREQMIPVIAVIGAREVDRETVSIRIGEVIHDVPLSEVGGFLSSQFPAPK
ncbi:His/Gly/Thr/Pro-type tRNA ligase C-terminal domain-containing protein [Thioclava sp. SK-1]|uniref:His/Gly/Thr/Pro-type tRNA ligase C-terminal domain-containing protein n=1 Tax=Thioclava sp. SK-1 TaxID=1889770 RepID=UPI00159F2EC2|nr:His/Gly/Thr/Pro-type tRNA ligase C-terminal domain-containing protein [Thioclava sp. SK-1]